MADFDPRVDIRPTIAHGRGYNPSSHQHEPTAFKEFPKWVRKGDREFIANNKAEEDAILGNEPVKAPVVSVDIANLAKPTTVPLTGKRKYTKRAKPADLPPNLE